MLHQYSLAEPQYLSKTTSCEDLVLALYEHPSLDSISSLNNARLPDINAAVSEICEVSRLNRTQIQLDLIAKWLPPSGDASSSSTDDTTNFKINLNTISAAEGEENVETSLSRVIYLLRSLPQEDAINYLLQQALQEGDDVSVAHRLRAITALLAVAPEGTIAQHYRGDVPIKKLLQAFTYVSRLQELGQAITVTQFANTDMSALVEGIWRRQRHNPKAITLLVDLCLDFRVTTTSLWGAVLTQLTNFVHRSRLDTSVLEHVLLRTKEISQLWVLPALTQAWQALLTHPFAKAHQPPSAACAAACAHSADLLLRHCPTPLEVAPLVAQAQALDMQLLALVIASTDAKASDQTMKVRDQLMYVNHTS